MTFTHKIGVYTAIYGAYDSVKTAPIVPAGVPCILLTDKQAVAEDAAIKGWSPKVIPHSVATLNGKPSITEPMLNHKYWKTHPNEVFPEVDFSIWLDGSMQVVVPDMVERYLKLLGDDDWGCVPHPIRNCMYPEAEYSSTLVWRYDSESIIRQMRHYAGWHPRGSGLVATGCRIIRHTPAVIDLCHQWWVENITWSHQDQLSLPVLFHLYRDRVRMNMNLPWHKDWILHAHGS